MQDSGAASPEEAGSRLIAPLWHTAVVVLVLLGFSALGARSHSAFGIRGHGHIVGYLTAASFEWLMVAFVWFGLRLRGNRLRGLLGERWSKGRKAFADLGWGAVFLAASNVVLGVLALLLKATPNRALRGLFPQGLAEVLAFLLLSLTAGICEEILCRGYLQRQFTALSKSATAGVIMQGIIFGAAHGYQGPKYMVMISVYNFLFGAMVHWRRSLLPGMAAHFLQDGALGLLLGQTLKRTGSLRLLLG